MDVPAVMAAALLRKLAPNAMATVLSDAHVLIVQRGQNPMEQLVHAVEGRAIYTSVVQPAADTVRLTKNVTVGAICNRFASAMAKRTHRQRLFKQQPKRSTMKYETPIVLCWTAEDIAPVAEQSSEGVLCFASCHCTESGSKVCYTHK